MKNPKGKIAIQKGNENCAPCVVYVQHKNRFGYWVCNALNTGYSHMNTSQQLIEFDYALFERMKCEWHIEEADRIKARWEKNLKDLHK